MPIKGLTDRQISFPEIGSIRKGDKGGTNGAPRDLKYFRVQFDERETSAITAFAVVYDSRPTDINVLLPFDDFERCFDCYYEAYLAGALIYRSDGERVLRMIDPATGRVVVNNGEPNTPHKSNPIGNYINAKGKTESINYKPVGRLKVIVPELQRLAYLTVHTSSIHDVINLNGQLRALLTLHGRLAGIPLILRRRPAQVSMPGPDGKRVRREKWLLSIEADPEWVSAKLNEMHRLALPDASTSVATLLAAPIEKLGSQAQFPESDDDDQDEISDGDFYDVPAEQAAIKTNGKPSQSENHQSATKKLADVALVNGMADDWRAACKTLADTHPVFRDDKGQPNWTEIRTRAIRLGFAVVKPDNWEIVIEQLAQSANQPTDQIPF